MVYNNNDRSSFQDVCAAGDLTVRKTVVMVAIITVVRMLKATVLMVISGDASLQMCPVTCDLLI